MSRDPMRGERADETLRAAIRAASSEPPIEAVDWDALHARITAGAKPLLRRTRAPNPLQLIGRWAPRAIPLTGSAVLLLTLIIGFGVRRPASDSAQTGVALRAVEEELIDGLPIAARPLLLAGTGDEALLDAVLFVEPEEW